MPVVDYPVRHLLDAEVQQLAFSWRALLAQHFLGNFLDVTAVFDAVGRAVEWPIRVETRPDSAMGQANAFVSANKSTVYVRQSIVEGAAAGDPDAIFDIVHEMAHVILHRVEVPLARMATRDNRHDFLQPEESAEHQANVFARSFLMTDDEVALYPSADALAENCFVPVQQAALRLNEYDRTTGRRLRKAMRDQTPSGITVARLQGYDSLPCPECRNRTLVRTGTCMTCTTCGDTQGCS